ncbi:hypothetical protein C7441_11473 [Pseudaminobacter salicylatoxidans]|uniref:Uncharacterized protein n=1 Tax=Pseudaminobacter salicylatoxidans TaxID=93369 RepID=A0A316BYY9_PSESE|nr:hypothetical protein [Pseudaminobacter salicylatoxidans]PWJ79796.1 hypothetical protein C7441_11473 [Pseudaminobacter salicylatoxidans]
MQRSTGGRIPLPISSIVKAASVSQQPWQWFLLVLAANVALIGLVVFLDRVLGIDNWNLVRDPNAIANQPAYFGFYSNLGVLFWITGGSTSLFTVLCLQHTGEPDPRIRPLLLGGLLCATAALDDFFMFHEHSYLIGIPEVVVMAGYALLIVAFAATAFSVARLTNWICLATSLAFLALSTLVDMADLTMPGSVLLEEAFKFFGITFLAVYLVSMSFSAITAGFKGDRLVRPGI